MVVLEGIAPTRRKSPADFKSALSTNFSTRPKHASFQTLFRKIYLFAHHT